MAEYGDQGVDSYSAGYEDEAFDVGGGDGEGLGWWWVGE